MTVELERQVDEATASSGNLSLGVIRLEDVIRPTPFDNLHLLPSGDFSAEAVARMAQPAMLHRLFKELRSRYDFIVIDSSPLLAVPDALIMARYTDGLIFSVRPGVSQTAEMYAGYELLSEHRLPFIGVVINGVQMNDVYKYGGDEPAGEQDLAASGTPTSEFGTHPST